MNPDCYKASMFWKSSLCLALGDAQWRASSLTCLIPLPAETFLPSRSRKLQLRLHLSSYLMYIIIILIWSFFFCPDSTYLLVKTSSNSLLVSSLVRIRPSDNISPQDNFKDMNIQWLIHGSWTHPVYVFLQEMQWFHWLRPNNTSGEAYGRWGWGEDFFLQVKMLKIHKNTMSSIISIQN